MILPILAYSVVQIVPALATEDYFSWFLGPFQILHPCGGFLRGGGGGAAILFSGYCKMF